MTIHLDGETPDLLIEYRTSMRTLEENTNLSGGELPTPQDDVVVDGNTPQEILEEAGIITGDETSGYQVSHPGSGRPEDGPSPSQARVALNEILKADDGSPLPRSSSTSSAEDLDPLYHRE